MLPLSDDLPAGAPPASPPDVRGPSGGVRAGAARRRVDLDGLDGVLLLRGIVGAPHRSASPGIGEEDPTFVESFAIARRADAPTEEESVEDVTTSAGEPIHPAAIVDPGNGDAPGPRGGWAPRAAPDFALFDEETVPRPPDRRLVGDGFDESDPRGPDTRLVVDRFALAAGLPPRGTLERGWPSAPPLSRGADVVSGALPRVAAFAFVVAAGLAVGLGLLPRLGEPETGGPAAGREEDLVERVPVPSEAAPPAPPPRPPLGEDGASVGAAASPGAALPEPVGLEPVARTWRWPGTYATNEVDAPPLPRARVEAVARTLRECGSVLVTGHTDATGDASANDAISLARAENVRNALLGAGLHPDRVRAVGVGARDLLTDDPSTTARAGNRRVTLTCLR